MPPSASSKRPTRSALASVKAPRTWPNSSLSNTPSETPPAFTVDHRPRRARSTTACSALRDDALAGAVLAGDQDVRVRRADARDDLQHGLHRGRFRDERAACPSPRSSEFSGLEPLRLRAARALSSICVRTMASRRALSHGFWTKSRGAAAHRLDRDVDAAPGRHDDDGQAAGRCRCMRDSRSSPSSPDVGVARVVQVDQRDVELARLDAPRGRRRATSRSRCWQPSALSSSRSASRTSAWSSATRIRAFASTSGEAGAGRDGARSDEAIRSRGPSRLSGG